MTAPTPLEKGMALIKEINAMVRNGVDHGRLNEIEIEAKKLESSNFVSAKRVLGVIAGMRGDINEIEKQFKAALNAGGWEAVTVTNYATALSNTGNLIDAMKLIDEAVNACPMNTEIITKAVSIHATAYDQDGTERHLEALHRLGCELDFAEKIMHVTATANEIIISAGATVEQACERIRLAMRAIIGACGILPDMEALIHDGVLMQQFMLDTDAETAMQAESAMLNAIADQPFTPVDNVMYFSCAIK